MLNTGIYERLCTQIVGRKNEIGIILAAIRAKQPILLIGMPGVSKTTILSAISKELNGEGRLFQATGDEQLSAYSLVGTFDPALVIKEGYKQEYFLPGPLTKAMRQGGILYIEEFNRAPSGALNVLMTALSDGYIEIPHYGRVVAESGFSLIGSSNPIDDIGTERLSRGLADRFVMLELGYQSEEEETEILRRKHPGWSGDWLSYAIRIARDSRVHPDLRYGSSIRGPIDFLSLLNGWAKPSSEIILASGVAAFLSKIQVKPSSGRTGAEVIREIMEKNMPPKGYERLFEQWQKASDFTDQDSSGGALVEAGGGEASENSSGGAVRENSGPSPPILEMAWKGSGAGGVRGASDRRPHEVPFMDLQVRLTYEVEHLKQYRSQPWISLKEVEQWGEQTIASIRSGQSSLYGKEGVRLSSKSWQQAAGGEIDIEGTLGRLMGAPRSIQPDDIRIRYRAPMKKNFIVFIDHSGSMVGRKLGISAVLAGALARLGTREQSRYGVYAFDQEISAIKQLHQPRDMKSVIHEIMHLPEGRSTDLSAVLLFASQLLDEYEATEMILVSDCMPTRGEKMFASLNRLVQKIPSLHICYVGSQSGSDFTVETLNGTAKLDLYGWWGYKWAGADRFYVIHDLSDVPQAVHAMVGHQSGILV
ncbi:AAA family ATPase [Ferviditalea candida]|uniref:AAA family ATPase n=1 Tax=Ferviditalea candida TaxID=3108399 RepID=A0ABU5ZMV9_9BACL|nr:AAA family ATPase [Paenibacillaceae bacterium T2]